MKRNALILFVLLSGVILAQDSKNMTLLGKLPYNKSINDVWGYVDTAGNEYAIVGVNNGVSVVDVTSPATPKEVYFTAGPVSGWRDMKTWNKHAYITNEDSAGLTIIDLSSLPDKNGISVSYYAGGGLNSAHNLYIDENGIAYIFGANTGNGGALMLDLSDPKSPVELGRFTEFYLHDGMARGDTLWGAAIYQGAFAAIDVSDKANPVVMATQNTPGNFAHNMWISDDGKVLYTTDERSAAYIGAFDVSDLSDIEELDRVQSNPRSGVIPHNTHTNGNFQVVSYYKDGVVVIDATRSQNMVITGFYDTYDKGEGNGFSGCWGTYPWLPSGNILASDMSGGLFILGVDYVQGCYLEGKITDAKTTNPVTGVDIAILNTSSAEKSDLTGNYASGIADSGSYTAVYSKPGYFPDTISGIKLTNGQVTIQDVQLQPRPTFAFSGKVVVKSNSQAVSGAKLRIEDPEFEFEEETDQNGIFTIPAFYKGTYEIVAGKWGYITKCLEQTVDSLSDTLVIELEKGIYDDFSLDFGWEVIDTGATTGHWERGAPEGTSFANLTVNPDADVQGDCSTEAYVTGVKAGSGAAGNDLDNGNTVLISPVFDATTFQVPYITYYRWFMATGGYAAINDSMIVSITNGTDTAIVEEVKVDSSEMSKWIYKAFKVSDFITVTATMQVIFDAYDAQPGHLVEAGVDIFRVVEESQVSVEDRYLENLSVLAFPNPFNESINIKYNARQTGGQSLTLSVFDYTGQQLDIRQLQDMEGLVSIGEHFPSGIYFVRISDDMGRTAKTIKIIKTE